MKYLVGGLAMVVAIFVIGCQDGDVSNPVASAPIKSTAKVQGGVIDLRGEVTLKTIEAVNGSWMLTGQASYTILPALEGLSVEIAFDGELVSTYNGNSGFASGQSIDIVSVASKQFTTLEKKYNFDDGENLETLHVRYIVTENEVSVDAMWVEEFSFGGGNSSR
jgi:hypothetical protein